MKRKLLKEDYKPVKGSINPMYKNGYYGTEHTKRLWDDFEATPGVQKLSWRAQKQLIKDLAHNTLIAFVDWDALFKRHDVLFKKDYFDDWDSAKEWMNKQIASSNYDRENTGNFNEGVADKYAAQKFGIQDPEDEFEKQYQQKVAGDSGQEIGKSKGKPIIKNPRSLKSFPPGSRAVITREGDLYIVPDTEDVIHIDILNELKRKGIIKGETNMWELWSDQDKFDFVTIQRVWNKNAFAIGESYVIPKPKNPEERKKAIKVFQPYLNAAKKKNPQFGFIADQVRKVVRNTLSPEEYKEYQMQGS